MRFGKYGPRRAKSNMLFSPKAPGVCCLMEDGGGSHSSRQQKKQQIKAIEKRAWQEEAKKELKGE